MSLYSDPYTALTLVRYHHDVIRDAFPRSRRRRAELSQPVPGDNRLAVVAASPDPAPAAQPSSHADSRAA